MFNTYRATATVINNLKSEAARLGSEVTIDEATATAVANYLGTQGPRRSTEFQSAEGLENFILKAQRAWRDKVAFLEALNATK